MRYLVMLFAILTLALVGCSDDDNPADAGTDAVVMEASVDAETPAEASVDAEPVEDAAPADSAPEDAASVDATAGD